VEGVEIMHSVGGIDGRGTTVVVNRDMPLHAIGLTGSVDPQLIILKSCLGEEKYLLCLTSELKH